MTTDQKKPQVVIDAAGKTYGRLASEVAKTLMGKDQPGFRYAKDSEVWVKVINFKQVKFTGSNKLIQKKYYRHSGYPGGLKEKTAADWWGTDPVAMFKKTVHDMLPDNTFRRKKIKRLFVI